MKAETAEQPVVDPERAQVQVTEDRDAEFVAFVGEAGPYLYRTAHLLCGDALQAEELVQATFERTYRAWSKARTGEPRAYARRILMNLRIDGWRKERRSSVTGDGVVPLSPAPDHASDVAVRDELGRALRTLPARQRRVVVMRHLLDLPEVRVADELGISLGTVKSTNARGLARMRSLLTASAIEAVPEFRADGQQVLRQAQVAARRRRAAQGAVAVASVLVVVLGLMLAGPVRVPGVGPVVLPGSDWLRTVLGLDHRGLAGLSSDHADTAVCTRPDDDAPTTPGEATSVALGDVTVVEVIDLADAHAVESCVDVIVDHRLVLGTLQVDADAGTLGPHESVLDWSDQGLLFDGDRFTGPSVLVAQIPSKGWWEVTPVARTARVDDHWSYGIGLVRQGDRAAWFETTNTQISGTLPWALRMLDADGSVKTVSDSTVLTVAEAGQVALADDVIGWTTALNVATPVCTRTLHVAGLAGSLTTRTDVRRRVCVLGSSPDGVVLAYREGEGGPGIGAGDGGSTVFALVSSPDDAETTLLSVGTPQLGFEPVTAVGYADGRLVFARGDLLTVVDVATRTAVQLRGASAVTAVDLSGETVVWSTVDGAAYALVSRGGAPSVFQLAREQGTVGVHGDRIVWTAFDDGAATMTYGRVRW
ncbi:SigE family RNA polymerase sigma factor [Promicromonospora sp. NPDC050249]|uniref:SigE family RNA polymerase sigma factor n=1 Tax=Promicromonospora sp. NPDC050249 TaxID=3154743 RepID=UPI0033D9038C